MCEYRSKKPSWLGMQGLHFLGVGVCGITSPPASNTGSTFFKMSVPFMTPSADSPEDPSITCQTSVSKGARIRETKDKNASFGEYILDLAPAQSARHVATLQITCLMTATATDPP